jgi:hypothetical protein
MPGRKRLGPLFDPSSPSRTEVKMSGAVPLLLPYAFMLRLRTNLHLLIHLTVQCYVLI